MIKKVKGGILYGILITWLLGIVCELTGLYVPNPQLGMVSVLPDLSGGFAAFKPRSLTPIFMQFDFSKFFSFDFIVILFSFLFVDLFDTIGTLIGVASSSNMLDKDGKLPRIKGALCADALATVFGACLGTSTTTSYIESATGVSVGGRTGLTALTTALLFGLSLFLSPFFMAIPVFATTPALVMVGFLMASSITTINFNDLLESIPAYLTVIAMPFCYSISDGISFGIISYVALHIIACKTNKLNIVLYILAAIFILKYFLL